MLITSLYNSPAMAIGCLTGAAKKHCIANWQFPMFYLLTPDSVITCWPETQFIRQQMFAFQSRMVSAGGDAPPWLKSSQSLEDAIVAQQKNFQDCWKKTIPTTTNHLKSNNCPNNWLKGIGNLKLPMTDWCTDLQNSLTGVTEIWSHLFQHHSPITIILPN